MVKAEGSLTAGAKMEENTKSGPCRAKKAGPGGHQLAAGASPEGRRKAAVVLEVLAGERTPGQASSALGIGLPRYYLLEQRALLGLMQACEPAGHQGRRRSPARELEVLRDENSRLKREVGRWQALLRSAQRAAGLGGLEKTLAAPGREGKRKRRKAGPARAILVAKRLTEPPAESQEADPGKEAADAGRQAGPGP
jgi:hypothetical protein